MAYKMTHPDAPDHEIEVDRDQVPSYQAQGWETRPTANPVTTVEEK